jgi:phosphohistidine phosphatase
MRRLFIARHATAQERDKGVPDFERALVKKGEKEAGSVARHLVSKHGTPDLMISGYANRAIETAHLFAAAFRYPRQKILLRESFYGPVKAEDLAREIRKQSDKCRSLMLVGHDPVFSELASHLVKDFHGTIPKAGVVVAEFPVERWQDVAAGAGRLIEFTGPGRIKEQKKRERRDLEKKLAQTVASVLADIDGAAARACQEEVRKSSKKLAKGFLKTMQEGYPARAVKPKPPSA